MKAIRPVLFVTLIALCYASAATAQEKSAPPEQLGKVHFPVSCSAAAQQQFDRAVALLHSFFFPETVKAFTAVIETDPTCGMGYWGLAMSQRSNPLILPLDVAALKRGWEAVEKAKAAGPKTPREQEYIAAMEAYFRDPDQGGYKQRVEAYERAMEQLYQRYPDDPEAAIFYALALNEAVDHADKTYGRQLKAGEVLEKIFAEQPDHPGVAHYIIHTYDFAPLAQRGLPAARRYAEIAPSSPHALHMPSHIFSMLGLWQESIQGNLASTAAAKAYAAEHLPGQTLWLHMDDFRIYAYLQGAQDQQAKRIVEERNAVEKVTPVRLPNDTAYAAIPVRYAIERGQWSEASALEVYPSQYPQAEAIMQFGRALGAARGGDVAKARDAIDRLQSLRDALTQAKQAYWADQVEIQRKAAMAWVARADGKHEEALELMRAAADLEDASEKHIAMENRLVPMRELLGELLFELNQPAEALRQFEVSLRHAPNRLRSFYGAAKAAERAGEPQKSKAFYEQLVALCSHADTERTQLVEAKAFLAKQ
jgi:tetratricopeptide (TPR) repeat protein